MPGRAGVKVTLMVQLASGARTEPHVLVWEKSPLARISEIVTGSSCVCQVLQNRPSIFPYIFVLITAARQASRHLLLRRAVSPPCSARIF